MNKYDVIDKQRKEWDSKPTSEQEKVRASKRNIKPYK